MNPILELGTSEVKSYLPILSGSEAHLFRVKIKGRSKKGLASRLDHVRADEFCALTCRNALHF